jgi:hypothetical protein
MHKIWKKQEEMRKKQDPGNALLQKVLAQMSLLQP